MTDSEFVGNGNNDLVLRAARGEAVERVPIWVHRQAGRYLPEFKEVRAKSDFFTVCRTPELACEVTLQPLRRIPYDAAIIFSDILVIPQAMGMEVQMVKGVGPFFPDPLVCPKDLASLNHNVDVNEELGYVFDAIKLTKSKLAGHVPLIGFSGAPWTLMSYMIEGQGSKTLSKAKGWIYKHPKASHELLELLCDTVIRYLVGQVVAGAQLLEVFDTWAGQLSPGAFMEFVFPGLERIARETKAAQRAMGLEPVPMTLFAKGAQFALEELAATEFDVLSIDWTITPEEARRRAPGVTLQGNLDPCVLYGSTDTIKSEVKKMLDGFGSTQNLIVNLGHGIYPDHKPEALLEFVTAVQNYKPE